MDAWYSTSINIEEALSNPVKGTSTSSQRKWSSHSTQSTAINPQLCHGKAWTSSTGLGVSWTRDGGIPQGCPVSTVFIVALYAPWCRHVDNLNGISPKLYADNLGCDSYDVDTLLAAAQYTVSYVKECMCSGSLSALKVNTFLSFSFSSSDCTTFFDRSWRHDKHWSSFWAVRLDVRDQGEHLDVTHRALAGTLSHRLKDDASQVIAVGVLPIEFQRMLGMVLHGCEGSALSVNALGAFRSAVARAVWSKKLPITNTPAFSQFT